MLANVREKRERTSMRMVRSRSPWVSECMRTTALVFLRVFLVASGSRRSRVERQQRQPASGSVRQATSGMDDDVPVPRSVHEMRRRAILGVSTQESTAQGQASAVLMSTRRARRRRGSLDSHWFEWV